MGLYKGGLIYGRSFVLVINKSDSHKQVSHKQENKHVLITRFDSHSGL
jgi:hypothetical protein